MKHGKHEYKTVQGHIYKYLKEKIDPKSELAGTLEEAPKYTRVQDITISAKLWEHLEEKLKITECKQDQDNYSFIYKNKEGYLSMVQDDSTELVTILLFCSPKSIEKKLYKKVFKDSAICRKGLHNFLDPNSGGNISEQRLDIANLIMFG